MDWTIEGGAALPNGFFKRNIMLQEDGVNRFRFQYDNRDVYITAWKYDSLPQAQAKIIGDLYFDLDSDDLSKVVEDMHRLLGFLRLRFQLSELDCKLYFSGSKGIHVIIPYQVFNLQPHENLNMAYRMIAEEAWADSKNSTIDLAIYDKRRLFRLPNSINGKTGLYKIPFTLDELQTLGIEGIKELACEPRILKYKEPTLSYYAMSAMKQYMDKMHKKAAERKKHLATNEPLNYVPPCIDYLLSNPTAQGQRNETASALVSHFRQRGMSEDEAWSRLLNWNDERCDPPQTNKELEVTFNSVFYGEYGYGCSKLKLLAPCNKECPIIKGVKSKGVIH